MSPSDLPELPPTASRRQSDSSGIDEYHLKGGMAGTWDLGSVPPLNRQ